MSRFLATDTMTRSTATQILAVSAVGFGLVPFFARHMTDIGIASPAVTFYRWLFTAVVLLPFLRFEKQSRLQTLWALGSGIGLGLGWTAYVEALSKIDVSTVGVIYMTYPLFAVSAAWILTRRPPDRRSLLGGALVAIAGVIALSPGALDTSRTAALVVAFAAPLSFGVAITVLTERLNGLNPLARMAAVAQGAVIGVLPLVVILPSQQLVPKDPSDWWLIIGIGAVTSLIPQIGYSTAAPFVGPARTATTGAVELPTIFLVGWVAFGETLGAPQLIAGLLVLCSVLLTPSRPPTWDLAGRPTMRSRRRRTRRDKVDSVLKRVTSPRTSSRPTPIGPQPSHPQPKGQVHPPSTSSNSPHRSGGTKKRRAVRMPPTSDTPASNSLTTSKAMRMALGPGWQFVGPTESMLQAISRPQHTSCYAWNTRYCPLTSGELHQQQAE